MTAFSLLLLLLAAVLHALSNALIKLSRDKLAFTWWMLTASVIIGFPLIFLVGQPQPIGWLIVIVSGLIEAVYFITLTRAYSLGDLSQVYPIARGSAPLFVLIWALLFLGERPTPIGVGGIFVVVIGLYLVNLPSLAAWNRPLLGFKSPAARWALLTGLLISIYSSIDKVGVRYIDPLPYLYVFLVVAWMVLSAQLLNADRRSALRAELGADKRRLLFSATAVALLGDGAYALVLAALRLSPVSYVSPVRELSVVIGAWLGVRFLGEPGGRLRIVAATLVASGIIVIALGG
ncbi:MAG TPA: EamA family transporter [Anaerolineae bacterium]|nr:EamA family transporter [Anaerolineae bacterium]